jgi:uncharacterized protein YyaL (SSP411 family)
MTANTEWEQMADKALKLFSKSIEKTPTSFGAALQSLDFLEGDTREIVVAGSQNDAETTQFLRLLHDRFLPRSVVVSHDPEDDAIGDLVPYLSDFEMKDGKSTAYICQNYTCDLPTNDPDKMMSLIK